MDRTAPSTTDPAHAPRDWPAWHPLSDRLRWLKLPLLLAALIASGVHLGRVGDRETVYVDEMLAEPAQYHGEDVYLGQFRVERIEGDRAWLWSPWVEIAAAPIPAGLAAGDPVSVRGTFQRDGTVQVDTWRVHELLWIKKAVGIVASLGALVLMTMALVRGRRRDA